MEVTSNPIGTAPAQLESFFETTSGARLAQRKGEIYENSRPKMRRTPAGSNPVLYRYLSLFQINDFAGVVQRTHSAISRIFFHF